MTASQALSLVKKEGVVLEAARGPVPNFVDAVAGPSRSGSWWTHPRGREIFALTRLLRERPEILVTRLVEDHITYVHRRVWPALVRLAPKLGAPRVARIREVHTESGAHRIESQPFPAWVPDDVRSLAGELTEEAAVDQLGDWIVPYLAKTAKRSGTARVASRAQRRHR
jgi:hypothetical protein